MSKSFILICFSEVSLSRSSYFGLLVSIYSFYYPNFLWAIQGNNKPLPSCSLPSIFLGASSDLPRNFLQHHGPNFLLRGSNDLRGGPHEETPSFSANAENQQSIKRCCHRVACRTQPAAGSDRGSLPWRTLSRNSLCERFFLNRPRGRPDV